MRKRKLKKLSEGDTIMFYSKSNNDIKSGKVIEFAKGELIIECFDKEGRLLNICTKDLVF